MALWSGRLTGGMSEAMTELNQSIAVDIHLLPFDLRVNQAWAWELHQIHLLTSEEFEQIENALDVIFEEYKDGKINVSELADEDVHSFVERRLTEICGEVGAKIHAGKSRNDQVATDTRLFIREMLQILGENAAELMKTLCDRAEEHQNTIMPGYTHMQQAQPISLAHYLLAFAWTLQNDIDRMVDFLARTDLCPLGSGALAGSGFPIDRTEVAKALGFSEPTPNSIAAISNRDDCIEAVHMCSMIMLHMSRYCEDWIVWSAPEFGFVEFSDAVTTGSSMMPQKKNPDALELIRGKTARVLGNMHTLYNLVKGLPLTYARDLQEDKPPLFDALQQTILCLEVMNEAVRTADFKSERMLAALSGGLYATELADYLVIQGVPFRQAHEIVGGIVRACAEQGKELREQSAKDLRELIPLSHQKFAAGFAEDVTTCFDTNTALKRRNLIGGTGPESVARQLTELREWLKNSAS